VNQSLVNIEIIVSDNCSENDLQQIVRDINDPRIRYHRNRSNIGAMNNFIKAASLARGEYLKFLCSDDLLLPDCLKVSLGELESSPDADALLFKMSSHNEGDEINTVTYPLPWQGIAKNISYTEYPEIFEFLNVSPSAMLIRKDAFWELGGFDRTLRAMGDWELYIRMLQFGGGVFFCNRVLAIRVEHVSNESIVQAGNLGFLQDVLQLRRRGAPDNHVKSADLIWRQLSQSIRAGVSIIPILRMVYNYGYLGHFFVMLPILIFLHTQARILLLKSKPDSRLDCHADMDEKGMKLKQVMSKTWIECHSWKSRDEK